MVKQFLSISLIFCLFLIANLSAIVSKIGKETEIPIFRIHSNIDPQKPNLTLLSAGSYGEKNNLCCQLLPSVFHFTKVDISIQSGQYMNMACG